MLIKSKKELQNRNLTQGLTVGDKLKFKDFWLYHNDSQHGVDFLFFANYDEIHDLVLYRGASEVMGIIEKYLPYKEFTNQVEELGGQLQSSGPYLQLILHSTLPLRYMFDLFGGDSIESKVIIEEKEDRTLFIYKDIILEVMGKPNYEIL